MSGGFTPCRWMEVCIMFQSPKNRRVHALIGIPQNHMICVKDFFPINTCIGYTTLTFAAIMNIVFIKVLWQSLRWTKYWIDVPCPPLCDKIHFTLLCHARMHGLMHDGRLRACPSYLLGLLYGCKVMNVLKWLCAIRFRVSAFGGYIKGPSPSLIL